MTLERLRAVIFDFDGTMCDSESVWCDALTNAYESAGLVFDRESFWEAKGMPSDSFDAFSVLANHTGRDAAIVEATMDSAVVQELGASGPSSGIKELIDALHQDRVALAISSNNTEEHITAVLNLWGLSHFFGVVVGRTPGRAQKPDPAPYARALTLLGLLPEQTVAIEDSTSGVRSATGAGIRCFFVGGPQIVTSNPHVTWVASVDELTYRSDVGIHVDAR